MNNSMSQNEISGIYENAYKPHTTKNKKTVVGCKRPEGLAFKGLNRKGRIKSRSVKGGVEASLLKKIKELLIQEYNEAGGYTLAFLRKTDMDHIHGRHKEGFPLTAMFDPRNLQLLDWQTHEYKTNAPTGEEQRQDYRSKAVQERLITVALRLEKKVGKAWTTYELKEAVESEIYA